MPVREVVPPESPLSLPPSDPRERKPPALKPGKLSFKVPINSRARRGLQRHHRLALAVRISLTPKLGSAVRISRTVLLHA